MKGGEDLIAVREFSLDGREGAVRVELDRPIKSPGHDDYCCSFRILGLGADLSSHACGIDAIQAIMLALTKIGVILHSSDEARSGRLAWPSAGSGDFGLPVTEGMRNSGKRSGR